MPSAHLLDYVAGNVRSLVNAIEKVGYTVHWVKDPKDIEDAEVRIPYVVYFRVLISSREAHSAWRRSFRALPQTICRWWLLRPYS